MRPIRAVLFDLDGTIADSRGAIRQAINHTLEVHGFETLEFDHVKSLIGMPLSEILAIRAPRSAIPQMVDYYRRHYVANSIQKEEPYEGMVELLHWLKKKGVMVGVVTTKSDMEAIEVAEFLGFSDIVDVIIGDNDARNLKPHPEPVLDACLALGINPSESVMVGDTFADVGAGNAAGCETSIGVLWGNGTRTSLEKAKASFIVENVDELKLILKKLI